MKLALTRAGLWFFGSIIVAYMLGSSDEAFREQSDMDTLTAMLIIGFVCGAAAFFYALSQRYAEERRLELSERQMKIDRARDEASSGESTGGTPS